MKLTFTKMHGLGNDYIYFDCFGCEIKNPSEIAKVLSNRNFSVGGDGIVLICPPEDSINDGRMRMFNADGSEGKMCGNAIRCVGKYLYEHGMLKTKKEIIRVETLSGVKVLHLTLENDLVKSVRVDMGKAELDCENIPAIFNKDKIINEKVSFGGVDYNITCVSMGNPHCVTFVSDTKNIDILKIGSIFENHSMFPQRVNTEFIRVIDSKTLEMRVFERGSGETLAFGTGACAAVVAACENGYCNKDEDITVRLLGGDLIIKYTDTTVYMTGPCEYSFKGEVEI